MNFLEVKNLNVSLDGEKIIDNLSFQVTPGEILTILGPNGAGKSVLLRTLLGFLPYEGTITWQQKSKIGYLPQVIENTTFRELKTGWLIDNIPKKTEPAVRTHVFLTVCMYNMCKAYRSQLGEEITERGIRKFRTKTFADTINKVVIISEPYYGIFDLEELAILWGRPPKYFMSINPKKFKEEYGLTEKFSDAEKI